VFGLEEFLCSEASIGAINSEHVLNIKKIGTIWVSVSSAIGN
jgi:hypothetical protein